MSDKLIHRTVDGWDLCSREGADWWVRDVELAERAGLARPREIRATIRKIIEEGVIVEASAIQGAATDRALFLGRKTLVPPPWDRGHQEVTEYLLNRKAAVLIAMRLRTEKAAELVDAIVTVFLRVADGSLAGEELRALREERAALGAELALMKGEMVKLSSKVLDVENALLLGGGQASSTQRGLLRSAKRRVALLYVEAGWSESLRSAFRTLQNGIRVATGWGGSGQSDSLLPSDLFTRAQAYLLGEENKVVRFLKRRAQQPLPGIEESGQPIKGRKKKS